MLLILVLATSWRWLVFGEETVFDGDDQGQKSKQQQSKCGKGGKQQLDLEVQTKKCVCNAPENYFWPHLGEAAGNTSGSDLWRKKVVSLYWLRGHLLWSDKAWIMKRMAGADGPGMIPGLPVMDASVDLGDGGLAEQVEGMLGRANGESVEGLGSGVAASSPAPGPGAGAGGPWFLKAAGGLFHVCGQFGGDTTWLHPTLGSALKGTERQRLRRRPMIVQPAWLPLPGRTFADEKRSARAGSTDESYGASGTNSTSTGTDGGGGDALPGRCRERPTEPSLQHEDMKEHGTGDWLLDVTRWRHPLFAERYLDPRTRVGPLLIDYTENEKSKTSDGKDGGEAAKGKNSKRAKKAKKAKSARTSGGNDAKPEQDLRRMTFRVHVLAVEEEVFVRVPSAEPFERHAYERKKRLRVFAHSRDGVAQLSGGDGELKTNVGANNDLSLKMLLSYFIRTHLGSQVTSSIIPRMRPLKSAKAGPGKPPAGPGGVAGNPIDKGDFRSAAYYGGKQVECMEGEEQRVWFFRDVLRRAHSVVRDVMREFAATKRTNAEFLTPPRVAKERRKAGNAALQKHAEGLPLYKNNNTMDQMPDLRTRKPTLPANARDLSELRPEDWAGSATVNGVYHARKTEAKNAKAVKEKRDAEGGTRCTTGDRVGKEQGTEEQETCQEETDQGREEGEHRGDPDLVTIPSALSAMFLGADFMMGADGSVWLLEINSCPAVRQLASKMGADEQGQAVVDFFQEMRAGAQIRIRQASEVRAALAAVTGSIGDEALPHDQPDRQLSRGGKRVLDNSLEEMQVGAADGVIDLEGESRYEPERDGEPMRELLQKAKDEMQHTVLDLHREVWWELAL